MTTSTLIKLAVFATVAGLTASAPMVLAQDATAPATAQTDSSTPTQIQSTPAPTVAAAPAPQLPYGVAQILQLSQAKVGDDTIVTYVKNSGNSFRLNADQIIYLQQQGLSSTVINAMLSQPVPGVLPMAQAVPQPSTPAPSVYYQGQAQPAPYSSDVGPSVTAIDPTAAAAASYSYYQPYYYPSYAYPYYPYYYGWYPGFTVGIGWGGGWRGGWGGGWHGGYGGGWHGGGGGGFHGGHR